MVWIVFYVYAINQFYAIIQYAINQHCLDHCYYQLTMNYFLFTEEWKSMSEKVAAANKARIDAIARLDEIQSHEVNTQVKTKNSKCEINIMELYMFIVQIHVLGEFSGLYSLQSRYWSTLFVQSHFLGGEFNICMLVLQL